MILYIANSKESTKKGLELINKFAKVADYKKVVFFTLIKIKLI